MSESNVYQRLLAVQKELRTPREVDGRFGKARSAEKILEQAKPICQTHGLLLYTTEDITRVGERNYITQTAIVVNVDKPDESIAADASAWEGEISNGLDTSQVSGKTSSYAKKYALQNLFAIDDTKDADQDKEPTTYIPSKTKEVTNEQRIMIANLLRQKGVEGKENIAEYLADQYGILPEVPMSQADAQMIIDDFKEEK